MGTRTVRIAACSFRRMLANRWKEQSALTVGVGFGEPNAFLTILRRRQTHRVGGDKSSAMLDSNRSFTDEFGHIAALSAAHKISIEIVPGHSK